MCNFPNNCIIPTVSLSNLILAHLKPFTMHPKRSFFVLPENKGYFFLVFTSLLLSLFVFCKTPGTKVQLKDQPASITTHTVTPMPMLPTAGDYNAAWQEIDSLEQNGLYKTALEKTEALYQRAKNDNNAGQVLKALVFRGKYTTLLSEDGITLAILLYEKELPTLHQPEKSVLQSMLAELYATYLGNQGWRIRQRTAPNGNASGDILSWSGAEIEQRALDLYSASVQEVQALRNAPLNYILPVLEAGSHDTVGIPLRPTLFDLLAYRALDHFSNERSYLNQPADHFILDQTADFGPAGEFLKIKYETKDVNSGAWRGVQLFQQLLKTQTLPGGNPAALIDADLARLQFVYNKSVLENRNDMYRQALEVLHKQYYHHPSDAEIVWKIASHILNTQTDPKINKNARMEAVSLCQDAIRRHPESFGAKWCRQLIDQIQIPNLQITTENAYLPNHPLLISANWQNQKTLYSKVISMPALSLWMEGLDYNDLPDFLNLKPFSQPKTWNLADPGDYYPHRTELRLDPLAIGFYTVMVADNPDFDDKKGYVCWAQFYVSKIAAAHFQEAEYVNYLLMDRQTGAPLPGVKANFYRSEYNNKRNRYDRIALGSIISDANGMLRRKVSDGDNGSVSFTLGKDSLPGDDYYHYFYRKPDPEKSVQFFTDRSIYRPGQTIYFKGVLFKRDADLKPAILPNENVEVGFYDANGQLKNSLKLRSNEFGTINGTFAAPVGGLSGRMTIRVNNYSGISLVQVEEYKRPKFEVILNQPDGAFRLNDVIAVNGDAKAYAGSSIDGAKVKFRITRRARFPFWDFGWGKTYIPWNSNEQEIAHGETTTDANGKFVAAFNALPDRSIPQKEQPVFDFVITADVTDVNGETRSASTSVTVGYAALEVNLGLSEHMPLDSLNNVTIQIVNRSGKAQTAIGNIRMQRLTAPNAPFAQRYWEKPDVWTLSEEVYKKDFPQFAWKTEDDPESWAKEGSTIQIPFNTGQSKVVKLGQNGVKAGFYQIELETRDSFGTPVRWKKTIHVWDAKNPKSKYLTPEASVNKDAYATGETATIEIGNPFEQSYVFFAFEKEGSFEQTKFQACKGAIEIKKPIQESDRGGRTAFWCMVYNNRFYGGNNLFLNVPWTNKNLQIQYVHFRDKLSPGQQEEWQIKISGPDKEKVAAELAAALYDESLDQFLPHYWYKIGFYNNTTHIVFQGSIQFGVSSGDVRYGVSRNFIEVENRSYPSINWFAFPMYGGGFYGSPAGAPVMAMRAQKKAAPAPNKEDTASFDLESYSAAPEAAAESFETAEETRVPPPPPPAPPAPLRTNLNETVFFFPELRTDAEGNVLLKFKMNEALTRWKLLLYGHSKDLQEVVDVKTVVTQKELMVLTNAPRFLRAGDHIEFAAKVSNLSPVKLDGRATLALLDAATLQPLDQAFGLSAHKTVPFNVEAGQSAPLSWSIQVPADFTGAVSWQIFADGNQYRDGEESTVPVVTNRMLVTETLPITVRGGQSKHFTFDKLKGKNSPSLVPERYTLEFTSNPAWYVVQSLPYLMEYPHQCSEQVFSRFYANTLASSVTEKLPAIRRVYERWKGTAALESNLSKNQELKYALLEETPWVMEARQESQQRQQIALLFDLNRMADERESALSILRDRQTSSGGWPWFSGGRESWYITQYIVEGLGHLQHLDAFEVQKDPKTANMLDKALAFCDAELEKQYREIEKAVQKGETKWEDDHLGSMEIHYLYTRSFFPADRINKIQAYYLEQAQRYWLGKGLYQEGMLALALQRSGRKDAALKIANSLRERAQEKEELGMYWAFDWGYYWYNLPIETQALMVEVFDEVANDAKAVENLRIWLLKNKQTNRWESTKATASAVYALLLHGENWLQNTQTVQVSLGNKPLQPTEIEPGSGYFKETYEKTAIKPEMGDIQVNNPNSQIVWGAAYWQYFEDLDKIETFKKTPLTIEKTLTKLENTSGGPKSTPITDQAVLKVGDKVQVRLEIRVDRPMEYVHLKDMRAAGFEPVDVLSTYRWQDGLGYYQSTKDLATHFFIDYLPRGVYVLQYNMVASARGDMSNGITTLQCMYAPEFTSHSKGIRVKIK